MIRYMYVYFTVESLYLNMSINRTLFSAKSDYYEDIHHLIEMVSDPVTSHINIMSHCIHVCMSQLTLKVCLPL